MRSIASTLLSICLAASLLAGCGAAPSKGPATSGQTERTAKTADSAAKTADSAAKPADSAAKTADSAAKAAGSAAKSADTAAETKDTAAEVTDTAAEAGQTETEKSEFPGAGVTFTLPDSYRRTIDGFAAYSGGSEEGFKSGVYVTRLVYGAFSREEYMDIADRMNRGQDTEEDHALLENSVKPILTFLCLRDGYDQNVLASLGIDLNALGIEPAAVTEGYTHYAIPGNPADADGFREGFKEEFLELLAGVPDIFASAEYYAPVDAFAGIYDKPAEFETTDLEGNAVSSKDIFGAHKFTLVNMWGTFCPYCIKEMPDLEALNTHLAEKDCAVIGIAYDATQPDKLELSRKILAENGVTYLNILPPEGVDTMFPTSSGFPTTFVVDSEGMIVGEPIVGANVPGYEKMIEKLLAGDAPAALSAEETPETELSSENVERPAFNGYQVVCVDEEGNPVENAMVQFCSETACMIGKTDANGMASFEVDPGVYTVHLLRPPAGFAKDTNEYVTEDKFSVVTIILKRS